MKKVVLLAGAAALGIAGAAVAKPGNGHGYGHGNPHAYGYEGPVGYGHGGCPPGLAKKNPSCMPPGQAKKLYGVGQRLQPGFGAPLSYSRIPYRVRERYDLSPSARYYYSNGDVYRVSPRTMVVQQVIAALLR